VATCVDQVGQATNVKVWALGEDTEDSESRPLEIIQHVWTFVVDFAGKADIEWRIVITRVGTMGDVELQGEMVNQTELAERLKTL
jgi:mediator of RNA polymerase II transcription subunit 13